jgi:FKBP-type peptidyl-prolyl cis-trans isomerase (trigger factor)
MTATLLVAEGLRRRYRIAIPAAAIAAEHAARIAEIASSTSIPGFPIGRAPVELVAARHGAAVLAEVIERRVSDATARLIKDEALRPALKPAISLDEYAAGRDLDITVELETLPDTPPLDFSALTLERLHATPSAQDVDRRLAELALRHGTLEDQQPRPARPGDTLLCDHVGRLPPDLLPNGVGRGVRAGQPGLAPVHWSIDCSDGLATEIIATGAVDGMPWFDLALRGNAAEGGHMRVLLATASCVKVAPRDALTLCMRVRLVEGAMPAGASARLGLNERSATALVRMAREDCPLDAPEARAEFTIIDDPAIIHARPVLEIAFLEAGPVDLVLRLGPARLFPGHAETDGVAFPRGTAAAAELVIGQDRIAPGFTAQLEGITPGQTREVALVFPADHPVAELASLRAHYTVTALALKVRRPAPIDDALAQRLGQPDLAALRAAVRARMARDCAAMARLRLKSAVLDALAAACRFEVPRGLVDAEFEEIWQRARSERRSGRPDPAESGRDEPRLRAECRALAERRVGTRILLNDVARREGVTASEADLALAITREAARHKGSERYVLQFYRTNAEATAALRAPLVEEAVIDLIVSRARVTDREVAMDALFGME